MTKQISLLFEVPEFAAYTGKSAVGVVCALERASILEAP